MKASLSAKTKMSVILHNAEEKPVRLVWIRVGNTRSKELLAWFERLLPLVEENLAAGELLFDQALNA